MGWRVRTVLKPAQRSHEGSVAKRERGHSGDENSVHGDWEVKCKWHGCILGPDGGDMEAAEAGGGTEWEVVGLAVLFCGQGLDSKRRENRREK